MDGKRSENIRQKKKTKVDSKDGCKDLRQNQVRKEKKGLVQRDAAHQGSPWVTWVGLVGVQVVSAADAGGVQ